MVDVVDTAENTPQNAQQPVAAAAMANPHLAHTRVTGRFDRYRSSYWGAAMAALSMRYVARPFVRDDWSADSKSNHFVKYLYSGIAGLIMYGLTAIYARSTWRDMRTVFAQTVGWELGKKPEDVGFLDCWKSNNAIVHRTMRNYLRFNLRRFGVNTAFFSPYILPGIFKKWNLHPESGADLGIVANATYLLTDTFKRRETFFEALQGFMDTKLNHVDSVGQVVTAGDLANLYALHARDNDPKHPVSNKMNSPAWKNEQAFFSRMADLMNQTYDNAEKVEQADFTVPKMNYLLGNGLIQPQNPEQSLNYIELANRHGIEAVKQVAAAVNSGVPLNKAVEAYPIESKVALADNNVINQKDNTKFAAKLSESRPGPLTPPPASQTEKLVQKEAVPTTPGL